MNDAGMTDFRSDEFHLRRAALAAERGPPPPRHIWR
jgi:hypothetical protein